MRGPGRGWIALGLVVVLGGLLGLRLLTHDGGPVARPDLPVPPARGWFSGGVTQEADFATWRGAPADSISTWSDTNATQVLLPQLHKGGPAANCTCLVDIAIGAIGDGETWKAAAAGAYDDRWLTSLKNLKELRKGLGPTFIRFAHEMNGTWFPWSVGEGQGPDFIRAWKRFRALQLKEFPDAFLVFSVNRDSSGSKVPWTDLFPGAAYVDAMGVDYYNLAPFVTTTEEWDATVDERGSNGEPVGIEAHRQFAEAVGLPLVVSEWGSSADLGDAPVFYSSMLAWIRQHAGRGGGRVLYENVFNLPVDDGRWELFPATRQPLSADVYETEWARPQGS